MGLQVYYPQDIERVLLALASAGSMHGPEYHKALSDTAIAFGVLFPLPPEAWQEVETDWREVPSPTLQG